MDDKSPNAWEKVIDRLLASPHYGEQWGRHWLDVAGYSDSRGDAGDSDREVSWKYRDYVIHAFNKNKPINQFIVEQLAGDQLVNYKHLSHPDAGPDRAADRHRLPADHRRHHRQPDHLRSRQVLRRAAEGHGNQPDRACWA